MTKKVKKCAAYVHAYIETMHHFDSYNDQIEKIMSYCDSHEISLDYFFSEVGSFDCGENHFVVEQFLRILEDHKCFDTLIACETSGIIPYPEARRSTVSLFRKHGVKLILID